jgi:hypothetical protein
MNCWIRVLGVQLCLLGLLLNPCRSFGHDPRRGIHPRMNGSSSKLDMWSKAAENARAAGTALINDFPSALDPEARVMIRKSLREFNQAAGIEYNLVVTPPVSATPEQVEEGLSTADGLYETAAQRVAKALRRSRSLVEMRGKRTEVIARTVSLTFRSGILVVHRQHSPAIASDFVMKKVDLSSPGPLPVDLGNVGDCFCILQFVNAPPGRSRFLLTLSAQSKPLGKIDLTSVVPRQHQVRFKLQDAAGNPVAAAVGLYAKSGELLIPTTALDFSFGGDPYQPTRYREQVNTHYWPGGQDLKRSFFVRGDFTVELPVGSYRLIATKGPEYLPVDRTFSVDGDNPGSQTVELKQWVNMSAGGWHSGDSHIHYKRLDDEANQRLLKWIEAEDLRIGNVLLMGDARETYFPQYAFGKSGRFVQLNGSLVPGQEDPRTNVIGHTIFLNIQEPIRQPEGLYYFYSAIFDEARRQGGLGGYAHVVGDLFFVHRDMTLNIPRRRVDFVEICEFGRVATDLYYEFLNLGFKLPAIGGSDAPWGGTVGDSRVYAYTGRKFDPDDWFAAVQKGRTFVTVGPLLEFTVSGHLPGDELTPSRGDVLTVHAKEMAGYLDFPLDQLEIVLNGEVIRSSSPIGNSASLDFSISADHSFWIAARTKGAHTSPVYVTVDGKRPWKLTGVPELLAKREKQLKEIEDLLAHPEKFLPPGRRQNWESLDELHRSNDQVRRTIEEAREVYRELNREYQQETSGTGSVK